MVRPMRPVPTTATFGSPCTTAPSRGCAVPAQGPPGAGPSLARFARPAPATLARCRPVEPVLPQQPAAVDRQVDAVDGAVGEQEVDRPDHVLHGRQAPGRGAAPRRLERVGLAAPDRAVADEAGV